MQVCICRKTWKAYLECLYCKVNAWILGGRTNTNYDQVCKFSDMSGSLTPWKILYPFIDAWDHGLSLFLILLCFCSTPFFALISLFFSWSFPTLLFFITYNPCLFFKLVWRMQKDLGYMEFLVCCKVKMKILASSQCKSIAYMWKGMFLLTLSVKVYIIWVECTWSLPCKQGASLTRVTWFDKF